MSKYRNAGIWSRELKYIALYFQKLIIPRAVCYNFPLVRDKPLGAPTSVRRLYYAMKLVAVCKLRRHDRYRVPGLATDFPCGVWGHGWTTRLHGPFLDLGCLIVTWCESLIWRRGIFYWFFAFIRVLYITPILLIIAPLKLIYSQRTSYTKCMSIDLTIPEIRLIQYLTQKTQAQGRGRKDVGSRDHILIV